MKVYIVYWIEKYTNAWDTVCVYSSEEKADQEANRLAEESGDSYAVMEYEVLN